MINSQKKKRKLRSTLTITYVTISIFLFAILIGWSLKKHKDLENQIVLNKIESDSTHLEIQKLQILQSADLPFFEGDYLSAKSNYKEILKNHQLSEQQEKRVQQKIDHIEQLENAQDSLSTNRFTFRLRLNKMNQEIDSLNSIINTLIAEQNDYAQSKKEEISLLKNNLNKKQKELSRKEDVRVISFKNNKSDIIHYIGEVEDGKANGGGIGIWQTGGLYKGDWKNNFRHGKGKYEWSDGHIYKGEFRNDERVGNGTYYWPSGERYEGEWSDGKRNGNGTLFDKDGNIQYEGDWKDDKIISS